MTTSQSPLRVLRAQATNAARMLKATERGEKVVEDVGGKIAASLASGVVKFAIAMDDKDHHRRDRMGNGADYQRGRAIGVHPQADARIARNESLMALALSLDNNGRCPNCLRKPLVYRREKHFFCHTCCRAYSIDSGAQIQNWAWKAIEGGFSPTYPNSDYVTIEPTAAAKRRATR